jgi:hypothetical protein
MVTANIPPADVQIGIYIMQSLTAAVRKNMVRRQGRIAAYMLKMQKKAMKSSHRFVPSFP